MNHNGNNSNYNHINKNRNNYSNQYDTTRMYQNSYSSNDSLYKANYMNPLSHCYDPPYNGMGCHTNLYNATVDYGPYPFVIDIDKATKENNNFRTTLWTGNHLQLTLMSIDVGEDIGLEIHPDIDQFIRVEAGVGIVRMGDRRDWLDFNEKVYDGYAFIIPAGKWHNLINIGNKPLKVYSIYAPPQHPKGTIHKTKVDAMEAEKNSER